MKAGLHFDTLKMAEMEDKVTCGKGDIREKWKVNRKLNMYNNIYRMCVWNEIEYSK